MKDIYEMKPVEKYLQKRKKIRILQVRNNLSYQSYRYYPLWHWKKNQHYGIPDLQNPVIQIKII